MQMLSFETASQRVRGTFGGFYEHPLRRPLLLGPLASSPALPPHSRLPHNRLMSGPEYLVAERLMPFPEVERIVLFGSRVRGDAMPRSDIDLAIACPRADPKIWSDIVEAAEEAPTLLQIDLVRMDTAPPELLAEIAREGRVLYERNSETS
jgi:uncharacterized protein